MLLTVGVSMPDEILPRSLTPEEVEWLKHNTLGGASVNAPSVPPSGPIDPVAEYEPMEGLVISWMAFQDILAQIGRRVTVEGNGRLYVGVTGSGSSTQASATSWLQSYQANLSNVTFFTVPLNSVWVRDYGPRYVYEGDVRIITDHLYNRPRPSDDLQPVAFGQLKQNKYYEIGINNTTLIHGGGNYHLNATGDAYATQLINIENPSLTTQQIQQIWQTYQNNNTTITGMFPSNIDATGHIDMWMQIYDDNKVFISDWPNAQGSTQDQICEATASLMQSRGYEVTRIPAYNFGGVHYTYTNMVIFNDVVLLPQYNNGPGAAVSNQVFADVQAAFTPLGKTVYQINGDAIVPLAGVFHCIVQHIPVHKGLAGANGGLAPTAYLRGPNNGETLEAGQQYQIQWISDDDAPVAAQGGVQSVDILLSTDGGQTFTSTIASNQPALGSFLWTIPSGINTSQARLRVLAHDGVGNTGFDDSDTDFTITDPVPGVAASEFLFLTAPHRLGFTFSQNVGTSLDTGDIVLENLTTTQTIPSSDLSVSYDSGTNTGTFTYTGAGSSLLGGVLPDGNYRATLLAAGITNAGGTPLPQNHVFDFFFLNGDADRDERVNLNDFNILAANFGQSGTDFGRADFNYDTVTNLADFNILASRFGAVLASPAGASLFGSNRIGSSKRSDHLLDLIG